MRKKLDLKDNPIFQRLTIPEPKEPEPPAESTPTLEGPPQDLSKATHEGQNLTLKVRPSKTDPQKLIPRKQDEKPVEAPIEPTKLAQVLPREPSPPDLVLKDHLDKALFFSFYNEMVDELLPTLDPAEQVLYTRLFRLSYGFNRNYCTVSQPLLMERTGLSRNTVRVSLQSLLKKGWIKVVEAGNRVSTTYHVILPREHLQSQKDRLSTSDPQNLTLKKGPSEIEGQNLTLRVGGSESEGPEGQNSALQNLSGKEAEAKNPSTEEHLQTRPPKFDAQNLTPLLKAFTNKSLTLSERASDPQNLTLWSLILSARELVDKFYSLLAQRPSKTKQEKSIKECLALLKEDFSVEEIDYAITWLVNRHPTTGSFSRVAHFIDQALKEREAEQRVLEIERRQRGEEEQQRAEQRRIEEEHRRIAEVKSSLSPNQLQTLREEALRILQEEKANFKFGKDALIQLKVGELIQERYLTQ